MLGDSCLAGGNLVQIFDRPIARGCKHASNSTLATGTLWGGNVANDLFLHAVEAIHASGVEDSGLREALAAINRLPGARGATLPIADEAAMRRTGLALLHLGSA